MSAKKRDWKSSAMRLAAQAEVYDRPTDDGADYILQIKVKNGPLLRALRARGYRSVKPFCDASGVPYQTMLRYLSLTLAPVRKHGDWQKSALKMAAALRLPPDMLFPEQHLDRVLSISRAEFSVTREDMQMFLMPQEPEDPEHAMIEHDKTDALRQALLMLPPKLERVLRLRFGLDGHEDRTLDEVGEEIGEDHAVTPERVRQLEAKALRLLRHPARSRILARGWDIAIPKMRHTYRSRHYACIAEDTAERERLRLKEEAELALAKAHAAAQAKARDEYEAMAAAQRAAHAAAQAKARDEYEAMAAAQRAAQAKAQAKARAEHEAMTTAQRAEQAKAHAAAQAKAREDFIRTRQEQAQNAAASLAEWWPEEAGMPPRTVRFRENHLFVRLAELEGFLMHQGQILRNIGYGSSVREIARRGGLVRFEIM